MVREVPKQLDHLGEMVIVLGIPWFAVRTVGSSSWLKEVVPASQQLKQL
jgi:hypothetical protein